MNAKRDEEYEIKRLMINCYKSKTKLIKEENQPQHKENRQRRKGESSIPRRRLKNARRGL